MKEYTWKPSKEDAATGTIVIEMGNIKERFDLAKQFQGDFEPFDVITLVKKHTKSVDIKLNKTIKCTDFDSFLDYQYGFETTQKLFEILIKGIPLENP